MHNNNEGSFNKFDNDNDRETGFESDFSDKEAKKDFLLNYKKLEEEYKNCSLEYENRIENLLNTINLKNSMIEDLHLRIKTSQEEYEEILIKSNNDKKTIKNLQDTIQQIKKENDLKVENLNKELKEVKEGLERRDYLQTEISNLREKYEKVCSEVNNLKQINDNLDLKCHSYIDAIAKLNEDMDRKEKELNLLNLKKKEVENELIKNAEKYGFRLSKNMFRNYSVSNFDGDVSKLFQRTSVIKSEGSKNNSMRKSSVCSDLIKNNLQSIYEKSDDSENEKYESNYSNKQLNINKLRSFDNNFRIEEEDPSEMFETELNEKPLEESFEYDDDVIEEKIITNRNSNGADSFKNLRKVNFKSIFQDPEFGFVNRLFGKKQSVAAVPKITNNLSKRVSKRVSTREETEVRKSIYNSLTKPTRRISLKDIIDADLEEFDNSQTRRQSIKHYNSDAQIKNVDEEDLKKAFSDKILKSFGSPINRENTIESKSINENTEKEFNNNNDNIFNNDNNNIINLNQNNNQEYTSVNSVATAKIYEISNYTVEITCSNPNKENLINNSDSQQKLTTNDSDSSDYLVNELRNKIEELTLKNLEYQSIIANERFLGEFEIKRQQLKIDKLVSILEDIKKRVKGNLISS